LYGDPYLNDFSCGQQHKILSAFAQAIREGRFSIRCTTNPKSESVRAALDSVAQAFTLADQKDPRLDPDKKMHSFYKDNYEDIKS